MKYVLTNVLAHGRSLNHTSHKSMLFEYQSRKVIVVVALLRLQDGIRIQNVMVARKGFQLPTYFL